MFVNLIERFRIIHQKNYEIFKLLTLLTMGVVTMLLKCTNHSTKFFSTPKLEHLSFSIIISHIAPNDCKQLKNITSQFSAYYMERKADFFCCLFHLLYGPTNVGLENVVFFMSVSSH